MFGEKAEEYSKKQGVNVPVIQSPKYKEARDKAQEIIESKKYGLSEGDFWILMNETKTGKMQYTGLIISHNGCLKINDNIDNKFKTDCVVFDKEGFNNSLVFLYKDDDVFEVGEVSKENCTNAYPYAMALKRCFDRVVLKKSKLAYAGVYSDSEAEEFSKREEDFDVSNEKITEAQKESLELAIQNSNISDDIISTVLEKFDFKKIEDITQDSYKKVIDEFRKIIGKREV